jgi:hypothetical protein
MQEIINNSVNAEQTAVVGREVEAAQPQETQQVAEQTDAETPVVDEKRQSADDNAKYAAARRESEAKAKQYEEQLKKFEAIANKAGTKSIDDLAEMLERQIKENEEQQRRSGIKGFFKKAKRTITKNAKTFQILKILDYVT